jgi:phosphohistidine phosphatase
MIVHFIRHAHSIKQTAEISDEHRFLSCRGRKRFRKVTTALYNLAIDPDYILTSPKIRAVQTAEILAERFCFNGEIIVTPQLSDFKLESFRQILQLYPLSKELVLVGHDPDFSDIVGYLLNLSTCSIAKGSVATLNVPSAQSTLSADISSLITGGGKLVSGRRKAIARLQIQKSLSKEGEKQ